MDRVFSCRPMSLLNDNFQCDYNYTKPTRVYFCKLLPYMVCRTEYSIFQYKIYRFYFKLTNHYLYNDHEIEHILYAKNNQVRAFDHHFKTRIKRKLNGHEKCVIFFLYQLYIIA